MKKLGVQMMLCLVGVGLAWGHADIEGLPDAAAILAYRQILYLTPDDLATRNKLAMALFRKNQLEDAKKELGYILKRDPRNFDALDGFGVVLIKTERYEEALQYLKKAVAINDKDVMVHVHLSAVYQKMKLSQEAQEELKKARSLATDRRQVKRIDEELRLVTAR
jgi:tetratricopeptide (TPR) repeat protein